MTENALQRPGAADLAGSIDFDDPTLALTFGAKSMGDMASFADSILSRVRSSESGPVGESLERLMDAVKDVDVSGLGKRSALADLPLVGRLFDDAQKTALRFDSVLERVTALSARLEDGMLGLLKDIQLMERLHERNQELHRELSAAIEAGEKRLAEARARELPPLEEAARRGGSPLDAQRAHDFAERLARFERRLHDLKVSRTISVQTAPQIRLIQSNDQSLAEKLQTSLLTTIPIWKGQMVIALSIFRQRRAARLQREVSDATNEMLRRNAELLGQATGEIAREAERPVVDLETLRQVQARLLSTLSESLDIAARGRASRREAEAELVRMEDEFRARLAELAARKAREGLAAKRPASRTPGR